jgi:hypothetical protein
MIAQLLRVLCAVDLAKEVLTFVGDGGSAFWPLGLRR